MFRATSGQAESTNATAPAALFDEDLEDVFWDGQRHPYPQHTTPTNLRNK